MMKFSIFLAAILFSTTFLQLQAQNEIPKGFTKGQITLADGMVIPGHIRENIHSNASITIIAEAGGRKKNYTGSELISVGIDSTRFLCIKGDFFKVICNGELYFLQKASDASGKPVYNGTEAVFVNGTDGQINDYFFYDSKQQQLRLLTKKNTTEMVEVTFNNCAAAISKAKETGADPSQLKQAVDIFNSRIEK
jgi:predicted PolB exonuclease-like 3'-5' exonuclease